MKKMYTKMIKLSIAVVAVIVAINAKAQTQLELSSGSMSSPANGATTANQTATKLENTTGTTFVAYSPSITVTASISNQQYTAIPTGIVSTGTGMVYGASTNSLGTTITSIPVFNLMNSISSPSNASYTSNPNGTAGTGIDVTANSGFSFYNSTYPLYNAGSSLSGRFYYGDLTLTFSRPVSDPVLQISGLGANVNFGTSVQGFSSELELQTSGVTASKLSGTSEFNVTANKILNSATTLSYTSGSGAASGSVKIAGTNITTLTFKIYVRGDGNGTAWSHANINAGDVFVIGVSMNKPVTVSGNVYSDNNGLTDGIVNGTGTNAGGTLYANLVDANNKVVSSVAVGSGGTYSFSAISAGVYTMVLSTTQGTQGATAPSATLPAGYVNTGEYVGSGAGSDGTINGITSVTVGTSDITNVNFGIYSCPTITNPSANQTICIGQSGSNITVNTSTNTASGYKFVRFTTDQIAGASATATELANIYAAATTLGTVTPTGASAPYTATYTWNSADFPNATTSPITYYVYAIANPDPGSTCRPVQQITVTVNPLPVIAAITGTTTVCAGQTTNLANATSGGTWKSVSTSVATINASGVVTGVSAGTSVIRYTVTNGNGCADSVSTTVTVNALPTIAAITGTTTVCRGQTTTLANATSGGTWKSVSTGVATINASGVVTGVSAGTSIIRYTVTNGNGCTDSVSTTVTVNALPTIAAITGTTTVCAGQTTTFANTTSGGTWKSVSTSVATINASGVVTGVSAGTSVIRYTVTNGNGCTDSVSTTVTVNALPIVAAITGNTVVAVTDQITLSNATSGGVWTSSNTAIATINSSTGVVTGVSVGTTTISYTVTNGSGCSTTVTYVITVNPKANG